ncbi:unnamed protein product [Ceutorhynchus assimilis]|uniref:[Histone H3]-lysine(4) N-trimethyltransferase n=1 Tax=Ceutorhynchus assimilis TaxID=467358 RepID=A0A9N9MCD4_9CUCU|nr:unnamed protein product [Ceutorhynchus assimilis]
MGRSKFPGKPSKHCHRKRVNVLPPTGDLNQEGHNSSVTDSGASKENKQDDELSENEGESTSQTQKARPLRRRLSRKLSTTMRKNGRQRNFITKVRGKTPLKNNCTARNSISKGHVCKDTNNFVGKFVLPTRSMHSSRVIKPNKRFIDLNETLSVKKKRPMKIQEDKSITLESDSKDNIAFSNGHRVILRQPRLKLPNQIGTQGPFSSNLHNGPGVGPGTIICGVCGAIRYYRFVKQARKFNIYCCESCRKFILKQIKRQNVSARNSNVLICLAGEGTCYVPPVERSQNWKTSKYAYRSRCPACWLKMCIKAFHLPSTLKQNLTQLLPKNMRGLDLSLSNSLPPIIWQKNVEIPTETSEAISNSANQRPVRFRPTRNPQPNNLPTTTSAASDVKRQKIDLKGPRVKHVCRSASIVLGQPLAIFGGDNTDKKAIGESSEQVIEKIGDPIKAKECVRIFSPSATDDDISSNSSNSKSTPEKCISIKKEKSKSLNIPLINKKATDTSSSPILKGILIDYSQDLNLENRHKSGFSLIFTKEFSTTRAMCYLCGSAGKDNMLVCCLCCEPYHSFCVDNYDNNKNLESDWLCIKCTPCQECKGLDKNKISCPKCFKIYHSECFSSKEDATCPKMICKDCTKCQDCGTATAYNLSSFPGNMPLCLNCLDKRKVGMHCPICQHSLEENNSGSKMLECSKCKKWVHSDCEKLTSEQYDILKLLPISSSFTCSHCLEDSDCTWRKSVQNEMYRNFNQVFRQLVKNKTAKIILRKVTTRGSLFKRYMLTNNLDIDNNNYNRDIDKIYSFEESERLQTDPCIPTVNTLLDIKYRLCEYNSVKKFNNDMQEALRVYNSEQIIHIYRNIFQFVFPWFSQSHATSENIPSMPYSHIQLGHPQTYRTPTFNTNDFDNRRCELCQNTGDGLSHQESRLLYCGRNTWVHANCAYWSTNVQEQVDNHLQNVIQTIENSKSIRCTVCDKFGASIQCHTCRSFKFHFMCARKADFKFTLVGKTSFCFKHSAKNSDHILKTEGEFEVNQALFIEQYPKDVLRAEPEKVTCLIGSLCVRTLGNIEPVLSDTPDAIIPSGFSCSRPFWSTKEPWKLVTYIITTSVQNPNCTTLTVDKNFTVDHSLERDSLDRALKALNDWRSVYEKKSEDVDSEDEEEKNGTELLSPELTDTLLEDLPHDILDGISVQDIFPNFSYEDMLGLDNSYTESIAESFKKNDDEDSTMETTDFKSGAREWVRTKSDAGVKSKVPPLSLTVSYKLDSTQPPAIKKRKISKEASNNMLLLQVDGGFDDDSSSECESPTGTHILNTWAISEEPVTCEKCQCTYRTQASYKRHLDSCEMLCTSESDSENMPEHDLAHCENESMVPMSQPGELTVQVNESNQPVIIQAFESFQSQVHTSVVNLVPEHAPAHPTPAPPQVTVQPTFPIAEQTPISLSVPLCIASSITPQIVQPSIEYHQPQTQPMTLQPMQQVLVQRPQPPRREHMMLQHIQPAPTPSFVPFVDAFGQTQTNQSLQYLQLAPQVQPQTQLLQIRSDGNVIGILPNIQPTTVIVQQPQHQLVLDSNGTFGWAQQPQPQIYYGFETIVQNTVMQSQQFLPTPVPGVLAANSSYSTTTQVIQTSKLEPVLDVSANSFVLVNSSGQLEIPQHFQQNQPSTVVTSQTPTLIYSSQPSSTQKPVVTTTQNCISLPTAPFVTDQNIPMNVVPPIPKTPTSHGRPMSRVLPMPTNGARGQKKMTDAAKLFPEIEKPIQIKLEDKYVLSKDITKTIEAPKSKNIKFEILDYKVIKSHNKIDTPQVFKVEENTFKEFEPVEKLSNLSAYEPLKEIEKVKMEMFEKPIKALSTHERGAYLKLKHFNSFENRSKPLRSPQKVKVNLREKPKLEIISHTYQVNRCLRKFEKSLELEINNHPTENNLQKLEDSIQKHKFEMCSPKIKIENITKNDNEDLIVDNMKKEQLDQKEPIEQQLQINPILTPKIEASTPKEIAIDTAMHEEIEKPLKESIRQPLDMPKLEDISTVEKPIRKNQEVYNCINEPKQNCKLKSPNHNIPTSLEVKFKLTLPKPKKEELENEVLKPSTISNISPLEPKLPIKKESETNGAPSIVYTMENKDEGFKCSSTSIADCWAKVLDAVQAARAAHNMSPLPTDGKQMKSVQLTGLKSSHVKYLVEQLPGASKCVKYKPLFKFTPHPQDIASICSHGFGAVRCQPHKHENAEPYDMFSWLSSKHREPFVSLALQTSAVQQSRRMNNFSMAMKFKNLKLTSKNSVGVYRSQIHGKGLFCLRAIEPAEMVIEYAGEVIRSILTDKREKFYNSKSIGCYMFRVDDNFVVDATMKGNAARFINHSCDPNCYSKVVEIMGHKHIIIFALRRIMSGEELTYDYKFPFEEDKIPCTCGARKCRKFLN